MAVIHHSLSTVGHTACISPIKSVMLSMLEKQIFCAEINPSPPPKTAQSLLWNLPSHPPYSLQPLSSSSVFQGRENIEKEDKIKALRSYSTGSRSCIINETGLLLGRQHRALDNAQRTQKQPDFKCLRNTKISKNFRYKSSVCYKYWMQAN